MPGSEKQDFSINPAIYYFSWLRPPPIIVLHGGSKFYAPETQTFAKGMILKEKVEQVKRVCMYEPTPIIKYYHS